MTTTYRGAPLRRLVAPLLLLFVLGGCAVDTTEDRAASGDGGSRSTTAPAPTTPTAPAAPAAPAAPRSSSAPSVSDEPVAQPGLMASDGEPGVALLSIPSLGIQDLRVEPYEGHTDDGPGTEIQDGGIAASPHGADGGTGPGGIGNYQVTAHRNTAGAPFFALPDLQDGARIEVVTEQHTYVYAVTETRWTSFRSAQSLAEQRAAVPGEPGRSPTQAMITLSTCATQEDHAAGNYWSDEFSNPEHRFDKIGVLVESRPH